MKVIKKILRLYTDSSLILRIIIGIAVGVVLALLVPQATWISMGGVLFVGALKAIAPVLVAVLVMGSLCQSSAKLDGRFGLVIFPQGTRDRQRKRPELDTASNGFVMVARESKVPVVPASIHLESDLEKKHPKCIVRFGEPISYEELGFTPGSRKKKELNAAAEIIWGKVQELWDKDEM